MKFLFPTIAAALLLAGCAGNRPASVYQGECRVFSDPGFRVRGLRSQDQRWVASTQESGISVCGWKRPPRESAPVSVDCSSVRSLLAQFGGDRARAEAYARANGATDAHIRFANSCVAAKRSTTQALVTRSRAEQPAPTPVRASYSVTAPRPAPVATPTPVSQPVTVQNRPVTPTAKPVKYRAHFWQVWRPKKPK